LKPAVLIRAEEDLQKDFAADDWPSLLREITDVEGDKTPNLLRYMPNDAGNAERVIAFCGRDLRYCHAIKKWLVWDGRRWAIDTTDQSRRLTKITMLEYHRQVVQSGGGEQAEKFARGCLDARRLSSALSLAEPEIFIEPDKLDSHPDLLNFLNGTVNLRTGEPRAHRREDFLTKLVHYNYDPSAECPTFMGFLNQIMGGGADASEGGQKRAEVLIDHLQKSFGYTVTGLTSEKVVFMPYGGGNNGKTTLLSTIFQLIPEHSVLLAIDTLMVKQESNNSQADLADLRGARFVMTSETEEGQRLAEGKLKRITQGMGRIKAVRKYENPIEFTETHKLWLDANHRPAIRGTDNAIWNRLHSIPFSITIPPEDIDRGLPGKLLREAEGILAWIVQGAMRWYADGLGKPAEVAKAGEEWRADMDQLGRFIEERCVVEGEKLKCPHAILYGAYKLWAERGKEFQIQSRIFSQKVEERGFKKSPLDGLAVFRGIDLKPAPVAKPDQAKDEQPSDDEVPQ